MPLNGREQVAAQVMQVAHTRVFHDLAEGTLEVFEDDAAVFVAHLSSHAATPAMPMTTGAVTITMTKVSRNQAHNRE